MWLARVLENGTYSAWEIDPLEVRQKTDTPHGNAYVLPRKPRRWRFDNWSGAGWSAVAHSRASALELAWSAMMRRAA